jgi:hypothetical protein
MALVMLEALCQVISHEKMKLIPNVSKTVPASSGIDVMTDKSFITSCPDSRKFLKQWLASQFSIQLPAEITNYLAN